MEVSDNPRQFSVGSNLYCLVSHPETKLPPQQTSELHKLGDELLLFTVINWNKPCFTGHDVDSIFERFSKKDDVWCGGFLSCEPSR